MSAIVSNSRQSPETLQRKETFTPFPQVKEKAPQWGYSSRHRVKQPMMSWKVLILVEQSCESKLGTSGLFPYYFVLESQGDFDEIPPWLQECANIVLGSGIQNMFFITDTQFQQSLGCSIQLLTAPWRTGQEVCSVLICWTGKSSQCPLFAQYTAKYQVMPIKGLCWNLISVVFKLLRVLSCKLTLACC